MKSALAMMIAVVLVCPACKSRESTRVAEPAASDASSSAATTSASTLAAPLNKLPHLTATDHSIAWNNVDAKIADLEKRQSKDRSARMELVGALVSRGSFRGSIADYERASDLAESMVKEQPDDRSGLVTRASTESTFHRFDAALADLDQAEKLGEKAAYLSGQRASIYAATGKYDEALALLPRDESIMRPGDLANLGFLYGDMGNEAEAERLIGKARDKYVDVSPFTLAWFDAQEGAMFEREGKITQAKAHYARALDLLPEYARVAAHLAALSPPADAIALLQPCLRSSDDPEIEVQLADAHRRSGKDDEATAHLQKAIARYDELLKKHPEAFSDHAAMMWLGPGRDPSKALPLAKANVKVRRTGESLDLWIAAALAAHDDSEACTAGRDAAAFKWASASLKQLAAAATAKCAGPK